MDIQLEVYIMDEHNINHQVNGGQMNTYNDEELNIDHQHETTDQINEIDADIFEWSNYVKTNNNNNRLLLSIKCKKYYYVFNHMHCS